MRYAIQVNHETNRIEHATFTKYVNPGNADRYIIVDYLATGETDKEKNITNYLYIDGAYIYNPLPKEEIEPAEPNPTLEERVSILENTVNKTMTEYEESLLELGVEL